MKIVILHNAVADSDSPSVRDAAAGVADCVRDLKLEIENQAQAMRQAFSLSLAEARFSPHHFSSARK